MRTLLLITFLLPFVWLGQDGAVAVDGSSVPVLAFKWSKSRQTVANPETARTGAARTGPARAVTAADKNYERNSRINDPPGTRDPNADTTDGRAAALEKIVQDARSPKSSNVDGYSYRVRVRNASAKVIEVIFWEYQFTESSDPTKVTRRQFLCGVNIKPRKEQELQAFSLSGPSGVVSADSLGSKSGNLYQEKVLINRVEYADGLIWQRKDWKFAEVRASIARATGTPWGAEMCRGL